jgi:hypothetical protein
MVTRKKADVLDIPEQYEVPPIKIPMSVAQRDIYEAFSNYVFDKIKTESINRDIEATTSLMNNFSLAMLAVENPKVIEKNDRFNELEPRLQRMIQNFKYEKDFYKLEVLDDIIKDECDENGNKIIICYLHPLTKDYLINHLVKR